MGTVGIEWVRRYHGRASELSNTKPQAEGFYNTLHGVRSFNWGDDLAWDEDFEQRGEGSPAAGTDTAYVDNVDIAYFSGHGSPRGPLFGIADRDDGRVAPSEVRWGDGDLDWIAFDACELLARDGVFDRWGWDCFAGLHYILGFDTTCADESKRGRYFAEKLNAGWRVRDAWIHACQETEDSGTRWAYLRADADGTNTYDDHWHGKGSVSPDPDDPSTLYYARGSC